MKKSLIKVLVFALVLVSLVACLAACGGGTKNHNVTLMDGTGVVQTLTVEDGKTASLPQISKDGYKFVGWYTDADCTAAYVDGTEVTADITLYAKYTAKALYITLTSDGELLNKVQVNTGASYTLPTPEKAGYDFKGFTYIDDNGDKQLMLQEGTFTFTDSITLTANWEIKSFKVTFVDGTTSEEKTVEYKKTIAELPQPTKTGYTFSGWYNGEFFFGSTTEVTEDITLTAQYTANKYYIYVTNYSDVPSVEVTFGEAYSLPTPDADDLAAVGLLDFTGYVDENGTSFPQEGIYELASNVTLSVAGTPDPNYQKSAVVLKDGDAVMTTLTVEDGTAADFENVNTDKEGYTFDGWYTDAAFKYGFNTTTLINDDITLYAKYIANAYTLTIKDTDENGAVLDTVDVTYNAAYALIAPNKTGYSFVKFVNGANEDFAANGTYTYADDVTVYAQFEEDTTLFIEVEGQSYFKEKEVSTDDYTYVFLTGMEYNFGSVEISANDQCVSVEKVGDDYILTTGTQTGTFVLTVNDGVHAQYTRNAKVVGYVASLSKGSNYSEMITNAANSSLFQNTKTSSDYVMDVGTSNFIPEIVVTNTNQATMTFENANMTVTAFEGETDYSSLVTVSGNALTFDATLVGKTLALTFAPKYVPKANQLSAITFQVKINDGINVYTNDELKSNYKNAAVHCINVLRNIKAALSAEQYIEGTLAPHNTYANGVYTRDTQKKTDTMILNGNYFTVDGSDLPYIDNRLDEKEESPFTSGDSYIISNVQIGIFMYRSVKLNAGGGAEEYYSGATMTMNNLRITGNYDPTKDAETKTVYGQSLPLLTMSSSYIGIVCRGGTMNLNNVTATNNLMGILTDGYVDADDSTKYAIYMNIDSCIFDKSWANSIYSYDLTSVNLKNTKIGHSNGAAISIDDIPNNATNPVVGSTAMPKRPTTDLNTKLVMDMYTSANINNWIAGTEAWFVAYGQSTTAVQLKQGVDAGIKSASYNTMTIVKTVEGVSYMNFAIFIRSGSTSYENDEWIRDGDNHCALDTQTKTGSGMNFFYSGDEEANAGNGRPYYFVSTGEAAFGGATYNNVMQIYLPVYSVQ